MRLNPFRALRESVEMRGMLYATDGREILSNDPDGWEISQPWLWWTGPAGGDGTGGPWGNPPPGAGAMSGVLPGVSYCTNLIAGTLAGLPWRVQRGSVRLDSPPWLYDPMALRWDARISGKAKTAYPAEQMSVVDFRTQWITSALWHGDGYIYAPNRDASGQPVPPIAVIHPHRVKIENGRYYIAGTDSGAFGALPGVEIPAEHLIHLRGMPPYVNGHGSGVMDLHGAELGLASSVRQYALGQFGTGIPAGYLKVNAPNMTQEQADALKSAWMTAHGGSRRSIAVLNATTDFSPIALSPVDAQLDMARQWSLRDIGLAFGVPSSFLGIPGDSSTYSNVESRFIELRTYTLLNWIRRVEATLGAEFPYGTDVKIVTAGLERGDTTSRYTDYKLALDAGFMTVDEVRELEDLPPLNGAGEVAA
jgi:HK97 family phage portal protein